MMNRDVYGKRFMLNRERFMMSSCMMRLSCLTIKEQVQVI